jgi:short-subunit dehydrogenase
VNKTVPTPRAGPQVIVITGASSGIGRAIALEWARTGATILLSGRNREALENVAMAVRAAGGEPIVEPGDVTSEQQRKSLIDRALREKGRIDVLVNNAGRGFYASVKDIDVAEMERLFALNVIAPVRLAQLALEPLMRSQGSIVMLSSVAGVAASPHLGAYAASKFALEALSIALRAELRQSGVRVHVIRPGPVETPFRANSIAVGVPAGVRPAGSTAQTPELIARKTFRAVQKNHAVVETSMFVRVASFASRVTPPVFRIVAARMARH